MADKIIYTLEIDDKNFAAVVRNANGEVVQLDKLIKKTGDDGGKSFQGLTATVRDLTVAYAGIKGAVSGVLGIFKEYIDLAGVQQGAESRLKFALKQSGDASSETFEKHKELGAELQRLTTVGDETSIKLMGLASQYGVQSDKLGDVAKGAIGLSEAFGVDLEGATKLLSGAMMGEYEMLNRLIPQMRTAKDDTERAAILNKVLANTFDYATERAKGFAGQQKQTQNNINDLKEEIGVFIRTALKPAYVFINDLSIFMKDHLALSIGIMTGVISTAAIPAFIALGTQLKAIVAEVTLATGGFNLIIPAIVAIATATMVYTSDVENNSSKTKDNTTATEKNKKAKEDLAKTTADLADNTGKLNKLLDEASKNDLEDERITKARAARDEYFKLTEDRIGMLSKELAAKKITAEQWNAEYDKILELEDVFNQKLSDAYDTVNADKIAKDAEAAAKLFEEAEKRREKQRKLDDEIFVENQELSRKEAEEQKKRVDEYNALQITKRDTAIKASEDVMQAEMDAYTEQYENQKAHNDAMTQLNNDYAVTILGGLELIQYQNQAAYDADIQIYRDLLEQKKVSNDEYVEYITKRTGKLNDDQTKAAMRAGKQGLKQMETDLKAASALGKDFAKVAKVISIANTTISSIEASIQAYKAMAGIPVIGPALGIAASAAALLAGAGAVAKITATSTGFRDGGYTGYGNRDDVAGVVHNEEFVNTAETVDRVGIPALEALEDGRATIVPIASVSKPEAFTGSANTEYIARSVQALSMNITNEAGNGTTETVVINNSDFVTVTKKIEQTKNKYKSVGNNKLITEY